jgi:hypothetical protein
MKVTKQFGIGLLKLGLRILLAFQCFKKNTRTSQLNWETLLSRGPMVSWNVLEKDIILHGINYVENLIMSILMT